MKQVLVVGNTGMVGNRFVELMGARYKIATVNRPQIELTRESSVISVIQLVRPDVVVNFAAMADVDACERERGDKNSPAYQTNVLGSLYLARACRTFGAKFINISTDYVFAGDKSSEPYVESDTLGPINWYGTTKYLGEQAIQTELNGACIARIEVPFVARFGRKSDLVRTIIKTLHAGKQFTAVSDNKMTPTFVDDVVAALDVLIARRTQGIYHVAGRSAHSTYEAALLVAQTFGLNAQLIVPQTHEEFQYARGRAPRPQYNWLSTNYFVSVFGEGILHTLPESLQIMKKQIDVEA
ncbi:MAG: NAD(P)-dependent oxidoreductase [DPANN group archaeon]|nr:NAD(P)-dependent oxidoreductase [DPANN group archaeon]